MTWHDPNRALGPQLGPPPPDRPPPKADWPPLEGRAQGVHTYRHLDRLAGRPRVEQVSWAQRYGDQVRTILEVEWFDPLTFRVLRERWDPAHEETMP